MPFRSSIYHSNVTILHNVTMTHFVKPGFHNYQAANAGSEQLANYVLVCDEKFRPGMCYYYSIRLS